MKNHMSNIIAETIKFFWLSGAQALYGRFIYIAKLCIVIGLMYRNLEATCSKNSLRILENSDQKHLWLWNVLRISLTFNTLDKIITGEVDE